LTERKRVLVIGLDGFMWSLSNSLIAEGVMPYLGSLLPKSCYGNLQSVIPFETGPAWASFQTGCLPGKTGIFAFHTYDRTERKIHLNSYNNIAVPTIWDILNRENRKLVSINIPVTSPPPEVSGIIIPGLLCPGLSPQTVHPPQAYEQYIKPNKGYLIVNHDTRKTVEQYTQQAISTEQVRCKVALQLMKESDWELFCVHIQSSDALQHKAWFALDPETSHKYPREKRQAQAFYSHCDQIISRLIHAAGANTLVMLISDHGFCTRRALFCINTWLRKNGYLYFLEKEPPQGLAAAKTKVKQALPPLKSMAKIYGEIRKRSSKIQKNIAEKLKKPGHTGIYAGRLLQHIRQTVDFDRTRALSLSGMGGMIYINGDNDERAAFSEKITSELLGDFGPDSDNPIIANITPGNIFYPQNQIPDSLPDLILTYTEGVESQIGPGGDDIIRPNLIDGKRYGTHARNGIFIATGPQIQAGTTLHANLIDIVPTILAYLDIALPDNIDGNPLSTAFRSPLNINYQKILIERHNKTSYTDTEQAKVEKHLSDLGYL
jgi:predicted AlkP superfamily phosphohydrolase/phosphomutase